MQRGIERALLHTQDVAGDLLDTFRNGPAVKRLKRQGAEDEQVQRALRKINGSRLHHPPLLLLQEGTRAYVEAQGDWGLPAASGMRCTSPAKDKFMKRVPDFQIVKRQFLRS